MKQKSDFPQLTQLFLSDYLPNIRGLAQNSIDSYAFSLKLFVQFLSAALKIKPVNLRFNDIGRKSVEEFLKYLVRTRGNKDITCNTRHSVLNSFFNYCSIECPRRLGDFESILCIPFRKTVKTLKTHLSDEEQEELLKSISNNSYANRRDFVLINLAIDTGLRISEILGLKKKSFESGRSSAVYVLGKGRKNRRVPMPSDTAKILKSWIETCHVKDDQYIFTGSTGKQLTRDAVYKRVKYHVAVASKRCPSLKNKSVGPHTFRHTMMMNGLKAGIPREVLAIWLGHEHLNTSYSYIDPSEELDAIELKKKNQGIAKRRTPGTSGQDSFISYLNSFNRQSRQLNISSAGRA